MNKLSKLAYIRYALMKNIESYRQISKIKKAKFKIIYSPSSVLDLIIIPYLLKRKNGKLVWVSVFDNTVPLRGPGSKLIRLLAWLFYRLSIKMLRRADRIFVVTPELQRHLISIGFDKKSLVLTGNAVEANLIRKSRTNRRFRTDALFMGRINEKKGIYDLLEVLKIVVRNVPTFKLGILGDGDAPTVSAYKTKIKEMNLYDNVLFFGYRYGVEKYSIIKSCKVFWFLSHDESFGVALLEAVCCGKPALAYPLAPYSEIYTKGEVRQFSFNNYSAIANKTLDIMKSGEINSAGIKLLDKYSWNKIAKTEFKSFRTLIE
jgi:glycosyltransferase involved in cell wall biosynthesis